MIERDPRANRFSPSFDVLGMTLDLAGLRQAGSVTLKTKEGRVEKISSKVLQVPTVREYDPN